jgi:general secretion pathway protein A
MYEAHFGLTEFPFSITPDLRYLYMSEKHREGLAHLLYGVQSYGGFIVLTGEVGTGKTTLCRCLLQQMPEDCVVAFIINPNLTVPELLSTICDELQIAYPKDNKSVKVFVDLINACLLDAHARGEKAVLIIDEAQNLSLAVLEQIRLLTNLETAERKLLQIILLGQPELRDKLARPDLIQLSQRIIARYHLGPLSRQEVEAYIAHRLAVAGSRQEIFTRSALREVYGQSGGIPRLVNLVCDRGLLGAFSRGELKVERRMVVQAAKEVFGKETVRSSSWHGLTWRHAGLVFCAFALLCIATYRDWSTSSFVNKIGDWIAHHPTTVVGQLAESNPVSTSPRETFPEHSGPSLPSVKEEALAEIPEPAPMESVRVPEEHAADRSKAPNGSRLAGGEQPKFADTERLLERARSQGLEGARSALFAAWGMSYELHGTADFCQQAAAQGFRCYSGPGGLAELHQWNRPAILRLFDKKGEELYAALRGVEEGVAVFDAGGERLTVSMDDLIVRWRGEYLLLWPAPQGYKNRLRIGDKGPMVTWLKLELSRAAGEPFELSPSELFDGVLENRVKRFQLANAIFPDGLVGAQTVNRLAMSISPYAPVLRQLKKGF